jgi:trigger factor
MLINFEDVSSVRKVAQIEVPSDDVRSEVGRVAAEFARQVKIPGFRPGKAPLEVVKRRFAREIDDEVVQRLLPRYFHEAVSEKKLETVGQPSVREMGTVLDGAPLRFTAEFEVKPSIELGEWRAIPVTAPEVTVSDDEIEAMLDRVRQQASVFRTIEERVIEEGDYATVDVVSAAEGLEERRTEGYALHVGEGAPMPELRDHLIGKKAGDAVSFEKVWGEDAPNEEVRGRSVRYDVAVREVRILEKPELTDELAQSTGIAESVEQLRSRLEDDIRRHKERDVVQAKRTQVGRALVEQHSFEVPESLVEEELQKSLRNYARFLASQGVDLEKAEIDWNKTAEEFRPDAGRRAKLALILNAIAKQEGIEISDTEVDAEIRRASGGQEFNEVRSRLRHDGGYEGLRDSIREEKALDLIVSEADVTIGPLPEKA